ncbi:MAG: 50S ribosomal protein L31 [Candidatus Magasanikbacteria bacterium CG10_big_fil_rev_8_21_14_0_10_40_10]|uniref:50S ribosomal protein L31 n=1 Tax=Candidatus Magasanikbacteria bacterium CG10_big_fil_rev_8_21_14_0_10_40_10 TaxID=1974648 RepID=A0A2M6W2Y3_9BACT|nr:MAG: 50S ribosomal protein L31 [Candidatus Magasanikbacteria bacterium CG10_big_fil_rev_8_21_14_0_10_40_10]
MKKGIHPKYNPKAKIISSDGGEFIVGSTVDEMHVEISSLSHPAYTGGKGMVLDAQGRVERYKKMMEKTKTKAASKKAKEEKKSEAKASKKKDAK